MWNWLGHLTGRIELVLVLKEETATAVLVLVPSKEIWLKKAALSGFQDNLDGTCDLEMSEWAAVKNGLA